MAEVVIMPKLGFNMEKGQLVKWHKKEGEMVEKGEPLFEILTDKTNMVIESTVSGVVRKILVQEGETVPVFQPIAIIGEAREDIGALLRKLADGQWDIDQGDEGTAAAAPAVGGAQADETPAIGALKLTPKARKLVQERGLDLARAGLSGTGFQGGITAADIEASLKKGKITPLAAKIAARNQMDPGLIPGTGPAGKIMKADVEAVLARPQAAATPATREFGESRETRVLQTIPYTGMRKIIGDRLSQSMYTAPHLYFTTSLAVDALIALRQQINDSQEQKVSLNDCLAAAVIRALKKHPALNASFMGDRITQYEDVNLGIAVGMETGLIVPVIRRAQTKGIVQIAREGRALIDKALAGKLLPDEYQGGTFTISNLGMHGIENFTAIINPPEVAILSVSAVKRKPMVLPENGEEKVVIRSVMKITLSVDHRVIDGLVATRFLNEVKAYVEKPLSIIL